MIPGINPKQMNKVMKQMGIKQEEIDAVEVVIRTKDKELVFAQPQVSKVNMMGNDTFQVAGAFEERALSTEPSINDEDIKTVAAQAGVSEDDALAAIRKNDGDLAQAILDLK